MNELKIGEREKRAKKARSEIIVIKVRIKKAAVLSIVERETRKGKGRGWPVLSGVRQVWACFLVFGLKKFTHIYFFNDSKNSTTQWVM